MKTVDLVYDEQIKKGVKVLWWKFKNQYTLTGEIGEGGLVYVTDTFEKKRALLRSDLKVIVPYSDLNHFEVNDKVLVKVRNHRTGQDEFRDGVVVRKTMIEYKSGPKHRPYPMVFVRTMFTYWEGDSNGNGVFYDKENVTGVIHIEEIKIKP